LTTGNDELVTVEVGGAEEPVALDERVALDDETLGRVEDET
jgi:hypothetical protein